MAKVMMKSKVAKKVVATQEPKKEEVKKEVTKVVAKKEVKAKATDGLRKVAKLFYGKETEMYQIIKGGKSVLDGVIVEGDKVRVYSSYEIKEFGKCFKSTNKNEKRPYYYTVAKDVFEKVVK